MRSLECAGSNSCQKYCEALRSQNVAVEVDKNTGCNVPEMFTVEPDGGIVFEPKPAEEARLPRGLLEELTDQPPEVKYALNSELIDVIGGALCGVLIEHSQNDPDLEVVTELMDGYKAAFLAKLNLWQAMLGATRDGRQFTDVELTYYQGKLVEADKAIHEKAADAAPELVLRAQAAADHATINEYGLLFDEQMTSAVDRLVSNLMDSKPTLVVGDKGIAKTQGAKFAASLWDTERPPVIISGHGDMMSNELIGQMEQDKDTKVFTFKEGKLTNAMREGRPVILDEVNVGDQAVFMRLQDILLLRPGQSIMLQENGRGSIVIQPGFVVFATANEASARYQHRNVLDPAFRDRYDIIQMKYPDSDNDSPVAKIPRSLMRLALSAAVDEQGVLSQHTDIADVECLVRLAHVTQHLYSVPAKSARVSGLRTGSSTSTFLDEEPAMTDCITPRTMLDTIKRCSAGNKPGMTLAIEMDRAIAALDQAGSTANQAHARQALTLLQRA